MPPDNPTRPLRIIHVVNVRWFNATAWYGLFLARILREAGHDVRVLGLGGTESFAKAEAWGLTPQALPLNTANPVTLLSLASSLRRLVQEFQPDIVNCHRGESFFLWAALKTMGAPFALIRTRGDQRPPKANLANKIIHNNLADAVIATSSSIARVLAERLHVPSERLHTIFGGVDTRVFAPDTAGRETLRRAWGVAPDEKLFGLVGRFDEVKGQKELIAAFARMRAQRHTDAPATRLVLAGFPTSSTSGDTVESWIREAGIGDSVILPGRCDNVAALMSALDLGVVASLGSETIARVALEIMACGVPLIGTSVGVMPDLLSQEALVPPGDVPALATLLERFTDDPDYGETLRNEQAHRMQTLSERDFLQQTLDVYRQALARRQPKP